MARPEAPGIGSVAEPASVQRRTDLGLHTGPIPGVLPGPAPSLGFAQKSWFSPAKIADTESSENTLRIVSARIPATDSTSPLSGFVRGAVGTGAGAAGSTPPSVITAPLPSTSPITVLTVASLCAGRTLLRITRSPPIISANLPASFARPWSGGAAAGAAPAG